MKNAFRFLNAYPLIADISIKEFALSYAKNLFAIYGIIWVVLEPITYFLDEKNTVRFKQYWLWYLVLALLITAVQSWPKHIYRFKLKNRDVCVELIIGNIWNRRGAIIIPINNRLAVNATGNVMNSNSLLRQLIEKRYNSNPTSLQNAVDGAIQAGYYNNRVNQGEYQMGTTVSISSGDRDFYLVCNTFLNQLQRSQTNREQLSLCLNELWTYLSMGGSKDEILMPLLGTGRGRINISREEVYKEILLSFIASCANSTYCDKLRICIPTNDVKKHHIRISDLVEYTRAKVEFADFDANVSSVGTNQLP